MRCMCEGFVLQVGRKWEEEVEVEQYACSSKSWRGKEAACWTTDGELALRTPAGINAGEFKTKLGGKKKKNPKTVHLFF